jgi:M6 family metalloprotease-like protein
MKSVKTNIRMFISAAAIILPIYLGSYVNAQKPDPPPPQDSENGPAQIRQKHLALGGAGGILGQPISVIKPTPEGDGLYQDFQYGTIYWTDLIGAHEVHGPIKEKLDSLRRNGFYAGYPLTDVTPGGSGFFSRFENVTICWSPSTGAHEVHGMIWGKWLALGGINSFLGYPLTDEMVTPDQIGRYNHFQGGSIYWTPQTSAREVHGAIREKWAGLNWERGFLGYPLTDEMPTPDGVGRFSNFQGGSIYWTPQTGAYEVHGAIRDKWDNLRKNGLFLGYPLSDETRTLDGIGRFSLFQNGIIFWTPSTGAHEVHGAIRDKWASLGWERSELGYPLTDEMRTPDGIGRYNHFQGGSIYWTPSTGAHEVRGLICERWASLGWERSFLGYPLTDETPTPGFSGYGRFNQFQGGYIYYAPDSGAVEVRDLAGAIFTPKVKPSVGIRPVLAILWDPHRPDHPTPTKETLDQLLFGPDPSVLDWYRENSGGRFNLARAGVLGWYSADKPADHYWDNQNLEDNRTDNDAPDYHDRKYNDGWLSGHNEKWAEAMRKAGQDFNFAACDTNSDGALTPDELAILIVIPQNDPFGTNRDPAGRELPNWEPLVVDGVKIPVIAEWYTGNPPNLGAPAHELSHLLIGTPDMYMNDLPWPFSAHAYSIMDSSYTTTHFDPFIKLKAGWLSSYALAIGSGEYRLRDVETHREVLVLYDPRRGPGEYFIIENRWRGSSYDAGRGAAGRGTGADGIAVWHIIENPTLFMFSNPPIGDPGDWGRRGIRLVRANGGIPEDDTRALFSTPGVILSDSTSPARLRWADGAATGFELTLLSAPGPEVRLSVIIRR